METSVKRLCRGRWGAGFGRLCAAALITGGLVIPLAHQTAASADTTNPDVLCRSDPVMVVNGAVVDVVTTIQSDPSVIQELDYRVTVPTGALIGQTTLTVGLGFPEKVTYVYSPTEPWGDIRVATTVITQAGAAIPLNVQISSLLAGTATASGSSDTPLTVSLDHLLML